VAPKYLLDTNICIYLIKSSSHSQMANDAAKTYLSVKNRFATLSADDLAISVITLGELSFGAQKSQWPSKAIQALDQLTQSLRVMPLSDDVAHRYGKLRATLASVGQPIGANDLWIAAHALALESTLVSNNLREFARVPGLRCENWA
jgi:tRNA(fMet)-specific endonuclease VapC